MGACDVFPLMICLQYIGTGCRQGGAWRIFWSAMYFNFMIKNVVFSVQALSSVNCS